jgi:hypothetical protein
MTKHKKSEETRKHDGRAYNKRLAPKPISTKNKLIKPARTTKAKKDRIASYGVAAMKEVFGGEKEYFITIAEKAKEGNIHAMKILLEYTYGKASDSIDKTTAKNTKSAPTINFVMNNAPQQIEQTIDITEDEEE